MGLNFTRIKRFIGLKGFFNLINLLIRVKNIYNAKVIKFYVSTITERNNLMQVLKFCFSSFK
jgi:hypothetical protein